MNKNYTSIIVLITILFFGALRAQETQKNFINYQGVARDASNELMVGESMMVTIGLKFGAATASTEYEENHSITTDANGVFSLLIGNGIASEGSYNSLPWGSAATFVTVSMNGSEIGTTELMAVPYAISAGNMKNPLANEVSYDNSTSGLTATTTQGAIDELVTGGSVDADADPSNEFQTLSFDTGTNELSLSDGNSVTIPSGGTDADADPTNEIQDISLAGTELTITNGSTIDFAPIIPPGGTDNQELTFNSTTKVLEIEDGNTVDLSSLSTGGTGESLWSENGGDVYYNSGKVGIGTTTPQTSLSIETDGSNWNLSDTEGDFRIGDATHRLKMSTSTGGAGAGNARIRSHGGSSRLLLGSGTDDVLTVVDQKVGIGTLDPTTVLDVAGKNNWDPNTTDGDFRIGDNDYRFKVGVALGGAGAGDTRIRVQGGTNRMMLGGGANDVLTVTATNIGVNTITPAASLDVQGDIRSSDLAGAGQRNVMADADGNLVIGAGGGGASTGLEILDQGDGLGWRLIGRSAANFGPIGLNAVDLSTSDSPSIVNGATGDYSTALGQETKASGIRSTAMGYSSEASGSVSFASGEETLASGEFAVAMGDRTRAIEQSSTAFGAGTTASGTHSTALGNSTTASGGSSTAMGNNTKAESLSSFAVGRNNVGGGDAFLWQANDPLFEIGNGTELAPNNALTVLKNGNLGVGTATPSTNLDIVGDARIRNLSGAGQRNVMADTNGNLVIGSGGGGSSLWSENGTDINYTSGNVGIGNLNPGVESGAGKYLTVATGTSPADNSFASIEIQGGQGGINRPVGRLDFISNSSPGNSAIGRVESRTSGGAQFRGDLAFSTKDGSNFAASTLEERMTIKFNGNVGVGTTTPTAKLDVAGDIKTSGELHGPATGGANMIPIAYGRIASSGTIVAGSGNFTVSRNETGRYNIGVSGATIEEVREMTIVATRINFTNPPGFIGGGSGFSGGNPALIVFTYNMTGSRENIGFSFVVYKP